VTPKTAAKEGPSRTFGYIRYPAAVRCKADLEGHRSPAEGSNTTGEALLTKPIDFGMLRSEIDI
jgi:hypothetical protein